MKPLTAPAAWRAVPGYTVEVYVSDRGEILLAPPGSPPTEGWVPPLHSGAGIGDKDGDVAGYLRVSLRTVDGQDHEVYVHEPVAQAYLGPRPPGCCTHHRNRAKQDNRAWNLTYVSGPRHSAYDSAKLVDWQVATIRAAYADNLATQEQLARRYGVTAATISLIVRGVTWRDAVGRVDAGGRRGEHNGSARLRAEQVQEIRRRAKAERTADLAAAFGVSVKTIRNIIDRRTWAWLPDDGGSACG